MRELILLISAFAYLFNLTDYLFSKYWVDTYGIESEASKIGRWVLSKKWRVVVFKLIIPLFCLAILNVLSMYLLARLAVITVAVIYLLINIYHVILAIRIIEINRESK